MRYGLNRVYLGNVTDHMTEGMRFFFARCTEMWQTNSFMVANDTHRDDQVGGDGKVRRPYLGLFFSFSFPPKHP